MTIGLVTEAAVASLVQTIYEDAMLVARENALATSLVQVFSDRTGLAPRQNFKYGTAAIASINETDDLISQTFTPSADQTLTPAEAGAQFALTDSRIETDFLNVRADAARELGMAIADKIDTDIFGNFNALTGGTVGTSGTALTWSYFSAMLARLVAQHAPRPYIFVCHPYQWNQLAKAASIASSSANNTPAYVSEAVARNYYVQSMMGVDIYVSTNLEFSTNDAYVAMFSRAAIAYDNRRAPRIEPERDASRRLWELNLSTVYAHGVWRPNWGIQGIFDATAPTS